MRVKPGESQAHRQGNAQAAGLVSRRIERVLIEGQDTPEQRPSGLSIHLATDPKPLGTIKNAAYSERAGGWLGFAMLPVPVPESGMQVEGTSGVRGVKRIDASY